MNGHTNQAEDELTETRHLLERAIRAFREAAIEAALARNGDRPADAHSEDVSQQDGTDSGLPDLPPVQVPVYTLGDLAEGVRYGLSRKAERSPFKDSLPIIRMGNIQDGLLDLTSLQYVSADEEAGRFVLADGDLLFNRTNSPDLVGKTAVFRGDQRITFASYIIRVHLNKELAYPEFVALWINSTWGRAWARFVKADGISQSNINSKKLLAMPVPLPPLHVQHATVDEVAEVRTSIDSLVSQLDSIEDDVKRAAAEALDTGVMTSALWSAANLSPTEPDIRDIEAESMTSPKVATAVGKDGASGETDLLQIVQAAGGSCTPTDLWQSSAYAGDIDTFYRELRTCIAQRTLVETVISSEQRMIEVAR